MNKNFLALSALFMLVLIDSIGASLILPLLPSLFSTQNGILLDGIPHIWHTTIYSISLASFSVAMFFGSPLLGDLADQFGHKKTLIYCLSGTCLGYALSALSVVYASPALFIVGRIISGFTAGSLPIAQAAIINLSSFEQRTTNLGYIMFAVSIAYILGPMIAGLLSFNLLYPFAVALGLSALNLILLFIFVPKTNVERSVKKFNLLSGLTNFLGAFKQREISSLLYSFLWMQIAWTGFFQILSLYATQKFFANNSETSMLLTSSGFGMLVSFCWLLKIVLTKYKDTNVITASLFTLMITFFIAAQTSNFYILMFACFIGAVSYGLLYPALLGLISHKVSSQSQGLIMGIAAAFSAFSSGASAILFSYLLEANIKLPLYFSVLCIGLSGYLFKKNNNMYAYTPT